VLAAMTGFASLASKTLAEGTGRSTIAPNLGIASGQAQKFTFILFWKEDNAATQKMAATLKAAVAQRSERAAWTAANLTDPAAKSLVERHGVSRAPMPLVLCVAPNGAITGAFTKQFTQDAVDQAIVTPAMTAYMKALQQEKIALVHVKPNANAPLPRGAIDFIGDPAFQARTVVVSFTVDDPAERRFLREMEIDPAAVRGSVVSVLAPPGVFVGKYSASVTKDQIAAELHAAGQCCEDPNCKHNKKAK
jgi:hypothetical protein